MSKAEVNRRIEIIKNLLGKYCAKLEKENNVRKDNSINSISEGIAENCVLNENSCLEKSQKSFKLSEIFPERLHSYYASSEL